MEVLQNLEDLLGRIAKLKMLVIGDLMLDRYIFGDAHRISPEAPVPVVDVEREKETLGAAGNVALNLRALGVDVEVFGTFGEDIYGKHLRHLLEMHLIRCHPDCQRKGVRTIIKTRVIVRNQQLCRLDVEDLPEKYSLEQNTYAKELLTKIGGCDGIIFSNYAKGTITQPLVDRVIKSAQCHGVVIAADPKPRSGVQFLGADLLKPNKSEIRHLRTWRLTSASKIEAQKSASSETSTVSSKGFFSSCFDTKSTQLLTSSLFLSPIARCTSTSRISTGALFSAKRNWPKWLVKLA
jgi:D-beta-D-heptose 7-phosphate kinase/D-beta-D-heptose 1-phosphate adenosyltransferase